VVHVAENVGGTVQEKEWETEGKNANRSDEASSIMPFKKIKRGKAKSKYRSPSGRIFTAKQVRLYYATKGFKRKKK
jgi:hypothetical protein